jgi:glyoxylase-like metal-dependent hydrolase (beta-lactamase superfamily II)
MRQPVHVWEDVYLIGSAELSHPYDCCVYLINAGELVLIDAGAGLSFHYLVGNIAALGFAPEKLSTVIVTHCHIDHVGALARFRQEYGVNTIAHKLDAQAIESGEGVGAEFYGVDYQPCPVDTRLEEAEHNLRFGKYELRTIHIPGHTRGSIAVYVDVADKRVLFGQDIQHGPYEVGEVMQAKQSSLCKSSLTLTPTYYAKGISASTSRETKRGNI